ncbi:HAD family hydrolase [Cryobacterium sp. Sr8]|uniref:HAD-IC family P-type ATPase n=1 Tax=Cryobacterium sp. Sr8 TaxID=1259203 RepID=UPI00106CEA8D|nr:HAD-IC family P-type ATPase [Cryobacterium sp. Sr8]TFD77615.1 HAD family hydrolase [Cryobacterium sp. Sr8]
MRSTGSRQRRTAQAATVDEPAAARAELPPVDPQRLALAGLSEAEVTLRTAAGLTNLMPMDASRSLARILQANLLTLFNAVVGGSFLLLVVLGYWQDALFGFFVIANVLIGVTQEYKAKRTLDRLALLNSPRTRVLRDGVEVEAARGDVVLDDTLVLRPGDQLPADAVILRGQALEIDESLLTGEADPVMVEAGREVLSGSFVVGGHGAARVVRVGTDSYANSITAEARRFTLVNSELRTVINGVVRTISWALIPVSAVVVNGQMQAAGGWDEALGSGAWREALLGSVASIVSMVPQGLVFMTSVAFAVSAVKLARREVLVQELAAVEGLARVDILCFDKTGTLSEGGLVLDRVVPLGAEPPAGWDRALGWFASDPNANVTARALGTRFAAEPGTTPAQTIGFSSLRKWSAASFTDGDLAGSWVLGAPDILTADPDAESAGLSAELASAGLRTLLLAHSPRPLTLEEATAEVLPAGVRHVAIIAFREKIRPDAAQTLEYFREQGVGLRIFSGDNPRTVAAVARSVGLTGNAFDARDLPADPALLAGVLAAHDAFGRVTPRHKKDMVLALQSAGHVVAMTGDGVNDVLALKTADIGIAMGSGAASARAVSNLVLLDGAFSRLPRVLTEGRQVIANIELLSKVFLTKTVYAIVLALVFGLLLWPFPFLPRQMAVVDGLTIGIPALFLALKPNKRRYLPGFLRRAAAACVPFGLSVSLVVIAVVVYSRVQGGYSAEETQSASVIALTLVGLWVLNVLIRPLGGFRILLLVAMHLGLVLVFLPPLGDFLALSVPPAPLLTVAVLAAAVGALLVEAVHQVNRHRRARRHRARPTAAKEQIRR